MKISFTAQGWEDYQDWLSVDPKMFKRLGRLIEECRRHPFEGTGKPEPLRFDLSGCWSRRITQEHRLVYKVDDDGIIIMRCRFHYGD